MDISILVNKNNPINKNIIDKIDFIDTVDIDNKPIKVEKEAYEHFLLLQDFCRSKGIDISIASAYRSFEEQQEILD